MFGRLLLLLLLYRLGCLVLEWRRRLLENSLAIAALEQGGHQAGQVGRVGERH